MSENIYAAPVIDFEALCDEARGPDGTIDQEAFRRLAEERSRIWYSLPGNTAVAGEAVNSAASSPNTHAAPANDFEALLDEACRPGGRIDYEAFRRLDDERSHIWIAVRTNTAAASSSNIMNDDDDDDEDEDEEVAFYLAPNAESSTDSTEFHSTVTPEAEPNHNDAPFQIIDSTDIEFNQMAPSNVESSTESTDIELNQLVSSDVESSTDSTESQSSGTSDTTLDQTSGDAADEESDTDFSDEEISNYQQATGRSVCRPNRRSLSESSEEAESAVPNYNRAIFLRPDRFQVPFAHVDPFRIPISGGYMRVMRSRALDAIERRRLARASLHYASALNQRQAVLRRLNDEVSSLVVLTRSDTEDNDLPSTRTSRRNQECTVPRRGNSVSDCSQCSSDEDT